MTEDERTYQRNYARTEKRKASVRRYNQSENGRAKGRAQHKRWRAANPEKYAASMRKHDLKRHYNLTPDQFKEMFIAQGYRCAACGSIDPRRKTGDWCIDHCHTTGKVRGILCTACNTALGMLKDDPKRIQALADYLERG